MLVTRKGFADHRINSVQNKPWFLHPWDIGLLKHCGKKRKCWEPAFSPFPTMFSILKRQTLFLESHFLLSADALKLDKSKILSFGKELNIAKITISFVVNIGKRCAKTKRKKMMIISIFFFSHNVFGSLHFLGH